MVIILLLFKMHFSFFYSFTRTTAILSITHIIISQMTQSCTLYNMYVFSFSCGTTCMTSMYRSCSYCFLALLSKLLFLVLSMQNVRLSFNSTKSFNFLITLFVSVFCFDGIYFLYFLL